MNKLLQVAKLGSSIALAAGAQEALPFLQSQDVILFQGDSITDGGRQRTGSDLSHIILGKFPSRCCDATIVP